jgi:hypothetical protein
MPRLGVVHERVTSLIHSRGAWRKFFTTILIYVLDLYLPVSVALLSKSVAEGIVDTSKRDIYFQWSCNCYIFFLSCILLHTYLYTLILEQRE